MKKFVTCESRLSSHCQFHHQSKTVKYFQYHGHKNCHQHCYQQCHWLCHNHNHHYHCFHCHHYHRHHVPQHQQDLSDNSEGFSCVENKLGPWSVELVVPQSDYYHDYDEFVFDDDYENFGPSKD